jgi:glutathione-regulated potassium-efflux system ancillary protein KefF
MVESPVLVLFAHPYPDRSRANRRLLSAVQGLPGVAVRSLYDLYPDFDIDVAAEQSALRAARAVVWQHPLYWYSVPGLLKHWFDRVLARGFAYGPGGSALSGKHCLWVVTTGGDEHAYTATGMHQRPLSQYTPVIEQTALFCGMSWQAPLVFHGAHRASEQTLDEAADDYRQRVEQLAAGAATSARVVS